MDYVSTDQRFGHGMPYQAEQAMHAPMFSPYMMDPQPFSGRAAFSPNAWTVMASQPCGHMVQQHAQHFRAKAPYQPLNTSIVKHQQSNISSSHGTTLPPSPRGPPRKPRQYGWAVWVGNLPAYTTIVQLKDHFAAQAGIVSVFLMPKTNCAFVNYRSESACLEAIKRFHDHEFRSNRLVCRMRRNSAGEADRSNELTASFEHLTVESGSTCSDPSSDSSAEPGPESTADQHDTPLIVGRSSPPGDITQRKKSDAIIKESASPAASSIDAKLDTTSSKSRDRYFILKSLTLQDLQVCMRDGAWTTQPHNEAVLNEAFSSASNVYLIFSVNKSGNYCGYARMTSAIQRLNGGSKGTSSASKLSDDAYFNTIPTPPTATAPQGRIVDDSARGSIFWEADVEGNEEMEESPRGANDKAKPNQGRQFTVRWMSTAQVPFYATRGLRNALNSNREVKIARDGTELDERVGRRLLELFHGRAKGMDDWQNGMVSS